MPVSLSLLEEPARYLHKQEGSQCCNKTPPKPNQAHWDLQDIGGCGSLASHGALNSSSHRHLHCSDCTADDFILPAAWLCLSNICCWTLSSVHLYCLLPNPRKMLSMVFSRSFPNHFRWVGLIPSHWLFMKCILSAYKSYTYNFFLKLF